MTTTLPVPCSTCDNVVDVDLDDDLVTPEERSALSQGRAAFLCPRCVEAGPPDTEPLPEYAVEVYARRGTVLFARQAHRTVGPSLEAVFPSLVEALPGLLLSRGQAAAAEDDDVRGPTYSVEVVLWRDDDLLYRAKYTAPADTLVAAVPALRNSLAGLMAITDFTAIEKGC